MFTDGPYVETKEYLDGLTIVDVTSEADARMWAGRSRRRPAGPRRSALQVHAAARRRRTRLTRGG